VRRIPLIGALALLLTLLLGCRQSDPAPRMETLQFPVVILFGNSSVLSCARPDDLKKMHTNYLTLNDQTPRLIDSSFNIFTMENLRSVRGGLWLMAHPSGITEVTFDLKGQKSGRAEAQRLFAEQLRKQTWRDDQASRLETLNRSQSLREMEQAISPNDS
jgi:hypothetical protein